MDLPMVSIIWINFNSISFKEIMLESLGSTLRMDYPNYELIIIDNGSSDGSLELIKDIVFKQQNSSVKIKLIQEKTNHGYAGGNNIGYKYKDMNSQYVVLLNNDAIPYKDSMRRLVLAMESDVSLGAAQGIILTLDGKYFENAGWLNDEFLMTHSILSGTPSNSSIKEGYISYAYGAYSIFRISAITKALNKKDALFEDSLFGYFEDDMLGMQIWSSGNKIKTLPFVVARHKGSISFSKMKTVAYYLFTRNHLVLNEICNSRCKNIIKIAGIQSILLFPLGRFVGIFSRRGSAPIAKPNIQFIILLKSYEDGIVLGKKLRQQGIKINIRDTPLLKVNPFKIFFRSLRKHDDM